MKIKEELKSIENFKNNKITTSRSSIIGGATITTQAWNGGTDKIKNNGDIKTNIRDWNWSNNDEA